jgi:hypothetical protein
VEIPGIRTGKSPQQPRRREETRADLVSVSKSRENNARTETRRCADIMLITSARTSSNIWVPAINFDTMIFQLSVLFHCPFALGFFDSVIPMGGVLFANAFGLPSVPRDFPTKRH